MFKYQSLAATLFYLERVDDAQALVDFEVSAELSELKSKASELNEKICNEIESPVNLTYSLADVNNLRDALTSKYKKSLPKFEKDNKSSEISKSVKNKLVQDSRESSGKVARNRSNQSLVATLLYLGRNQDAEVLINNDVQAELSNLISSTAALDSEDFKDAESHINLIFSDPELVKLRDALEQRYRKSLPRFNNEEDNEKFKKVTGDANSLKQKEEEIKSKKRFNEIDAIYNLCAAQINKLYDLIADYYSRFHPISDEQQLEVATQPFDREYSFFIEQEMDKLTEGVVNVSCFEEGLSFRPSGDLDFHIEPCSEFHNIGYPKFPLIKLLFLHGEELQHGVHTELHKVFKDIVDGVLAVKVEEVGAPNTSLKQILRWLDESNIPVLDSENFENIHKDSEWINIAARVRGALVLNKHWQRLLESELKSHSIWKSVFNAQREQQIHNQVLPKDLDVAFKRIHQYSSHEIRRYYLQLEKEIDCLLLNLKSSAEHELNQISIVDVFEVDIKTDGSGDSTNQQVVIRNKVINNIAEHTNNKLREFSAFNVQGFQDLWAHELSPKIVATTLMAAGLTGEETEEICGWQPLENSNTLIEVDSTINTNKAHLEEIVSPISDHHYDKLISDYVDTFSKLSKHPSLIGEVSKKPTFATLSKSIAKLPGRVLAPFAGLFTITMMLGVLSKGKLKDFVPPEYAWGVVILLLILFFLVAVNELRQEREREQDAYIAKVRAFLHSEYVKIMQSIRNDVLSRFKGNVDFSISDVLRRVRLRSEVLLERREGSGQKIHAEILFVEEVHERQYSDLKRLIDHGTSTEAEIRNHLKSLWGLKVL